MYTKPIPKIEKVSLSDKQKQEINTLLEGRKIRSNLTKIQKVTPTTEMVRTIKKKYFKGPCHICQSVPDFKLTYDMDGARLIEYYCTDHLNHKDRI